MENVPTFQYLGRPLDQRDDDWTAVRKNIMRAKSVWGMLGTLLRWEGGRSQIVDKFLQGGGAGNYIVWDGNVGPFGVIEK